MFQYLLFILKNKKNFVSFIFLSIIFFVFFRLIPQYEIIKNFFSLPGISFSRRLEVIQGYLFTGIASESFVEFLITFIFPILISLNLIIFIYYVKKQARYFSKRGAALSFTGIFLGIFGLGCLSCGALLLAPLLSFLGLSFLAQFGPQMAIAGLIFVFGSIVYLLWQLAHPSVCEVS